MALINCPECNAQISDHALACPHCGYQRPQVQKIEQSVVRWKALRLVSGSATTISLLLMFSTFGDHNHPRTWYFSAVLLGVSLSFYIYARIMTAKREPLFYLLTFLGVASIIGAITILSTPRRESGQEPASHILPSSQQQFSGVAIEPIDIRVTSEIVKKVAGKHRYFFDIRNHDRKPFGGEVTITLLNRQPGVINGKETFSTIRPIEPKLSTSVYMQSNTGPPRVHGD